MPDHAKWSPTRLRVEAIAAERSGQTTQAIALLEEALRRGPDDWKSVRFLGDLLARLGRRRAANEHYRRLAAHYENDQFHTRAIAVWKIVLSGEPDFVAAHVKLGELYALGGFRAEARKHYGEALAHYRAAGRLRDAALVGARIVEIDESPNPRRQTRIQRATCSPLAEAGVKGAPPEEGRPSASRTGTEESAAPDVDDVNFVKERLTQGRLFRRFGLADLAREQLVQLLARSPDNVEARRELHDLLLQVGRQEEAAEQQVALAALEGVRQEPMGDLECLVDVVNSEEDDDVPALDVELEALPSEDPLQIDLDDTAGPTWPFGANEAVGREDDEWTSAEREIRSAVDGQVSRDDYETRYDLGIAFREMGLLDEAIAELQLASRGASRLVECASLLAACFLDKGLPKLAINWLERGLAAPALDPQQALSLRYDLARAREARGERDRALEIYVELYGEDAGFRDVAEKLRRLTESANRASAGHCATDSLAADLRVPGSTRSAPP